MLYCYTFTIKTLPSNNKIYFITYIVDDYIFLELYHLLISNAILKLIMRSKTCCILFQLNIDVPTHFKINVSSTLKVVMLSNGPLVTSHFKCLSL